MLSRRHLLKSLGLSAFTLPSLVSYGNALNENSIGAMPLPGDPEFWKKVRDQFMLDRDQVFFNPGTVGAMPKVVVDKMSEHLKYIATHVADWAYKTIIKKSSLAAITI